MLALLAAGGLVAASMGRRWLTTADGDAGIGLQTSESCHRGSCEAIGNSEIVDEVAKRIEEIKEMNKKLPPREQMAVPKAAWGGWPVVGMITFIALLLAATGLVGGAAVAIAGKRPVLPVMPTTLAVVGVLIGIITGCVFIATKPDSGMPLAVGWSFMAFGGGIVLALAAVFPLNRAIRPIDEELGQASATMSWGGSRDDEP